MGNNGTDNNLLTYVMSKPNLDAVGHHWVAALAGYNFTIEYLRGSDNKYTQVDQRVIGTGHGVRLQITQPHQQAIAAQG